MANAQRARLPLIALSPVALRKEDGQASGMTAAGLPPWLHAGAELTCAIASDPERENQPPSCGLFPPGPPGKY